jgi:hypothetical protein
MSYLAAALGVACAVLVYLWQRATNAKKRLTDDLVSASEQVKRMEESNRVLLEESKTASDYLAALANDHPDLVSGYVVSQLRKAARLTNHQHPQPPAAVPTGDGGAGRG